ncbi:MAG: UDP-N-acetylmuramoyl-tripeptide--D-alanyl-D-alanine ligase [Brevinematales bacterium]
MFSLVWLRNVLTFNNFALYVENLPEKPLGVTAFSLDSRTIQPSECFVAIPGERFDGHDFIHDCVRKGVKIFIVETVFYRKNRKNLPPGIFFVVKNSREALGVLAREYKKYLYAKVIGVTGSSGKTTTRELISYLLSLKYQVHSTKKNLNNDLGLPLTVLEAKEGVHFMVLEMGMNHLGEIGYLSSIVHPYAAVITNVGYAHIGNLGSLYNIARAKAEIFKGMMPKYGVAFLNRNDEFYGYHKKLAPVPVVDVIPDEITIMESRGLDGYLLYYQGMSFRFRVAGRHNIANLAIALKVAEYFGVDMVQALKAVEDFQPVSGRSEVIRTSSWTIINDAYNANPSSMRAALFLLKDLPGRRVAIIGDMLELGKHSRSLHEMIGEMIVTNQVADLVVLHGEESRHTFEKLKANHMLAFWFPSKQELVRSIKSLLQPGDTIMVKASHGMKLEEVVEELKKG